MTNDNKFSNVKVGTVVFNAQNGLYGVVNAISRTQDIYPIEIVTSLDWKDSSDVSPSHLNVYFVQCDENGAEDVRLPPNWENCSITMDAEGDEDIKSTKKAQKHATKQVPEKKKIENNREASLYDSISESIAELEKEIEKKRKILEFILEAEEMGYSVVKK